MKNKNCKIHHIYIKRTRKEEKKMKEAYPVFLTEYTYTKENGFLVYVPGLEIHTEAADLYDAIQMARDAISLKVADLELDEKEIPTPMTYEEGFAKVSKEYGCLEGIMTYVDINTESYLSRLKNKSVRKNCSIPVWMDDEVKKYGISCSKVLQNALAMKIAEEREKDSTEGDDKNENKK